MQLLSSFLVVVSIALPAIATHYHHGHHEHHGHHDDHHHHHFQPYGFGYDVHDGWGNTQWRHEKSSHPHVVKGSYGYKDKHGIHREVQYVADEKGFRAHVKTNEPGTAPKDPAAVKMDSHPVPNPEHHGHHHGHHDEGHYTHKHHEHYHGHHPNHYAASNLKPIVTMPAEKILAQAQPYFDLFN